MGVQWVPSWPCQMGYRWWDTLPGLKSSHCLPGWTALARHQSRPLVWSGLKCIRSPQFPGGFLFYGVFEVWATLKKLSRGPCSKIRVTWPGRSNLFPSLLHPRCQAFWPSIQGSTLTLTYQWPLFCSLQAFFCFSFALQAIKNLPLFQIQLKAGSANSEPFIHFTGIYSTPLHQLLAICCGVDLDKSFPVLVHASFLWSSMTLHVVALSQPARSFSLFLHLVQAHPFSKTSSLTFNYVPRHWSTLLSRLSEASESAVG